MLGIECAVSQSSLFSVGAVSPTGLTSSDPEFYRPAFRCDRLGGYVPVGAVSVGGMETGGDRPALPVSWRRCRRPSDSWRQSTRASWKRMIVTSSSGFQLP